MQEKPHIVHTHGLAGGGYHGIVGACLARVPIIVNGEHGSFFNKPHQIVLQRFLARLCDANLSVSGSLKTKITEILGVPADKITVIRNGVDTNKFYRHSPRDEMCQRLHHEGFAIDDTTFNIFSIGSLKKEKAQLMLLRALKDVYISDPSVKIRVIFVGDGSDRTTLTGYAKEAGLEKAVIFLGNRSDVHELLNIADVLVSTSIAKHEGLSNVMLEAMSTNVPVIATRSVGAVEVIVDGINGFLIEPGDVRALVDRLMLVYNNTSLRDEMGVQARRIILEEYTITKMVQGYEQLYLDLVSRKTH